MYSISQFRKSEPNNFNNKDSIFMANKISEGRMRRVTINTLESKKTNASIREKLVDLQSKWQEYLKTNREMSKELLAYLPCS